MTALAPAATAAAVSATALTRTYGAGDSAVPALRGVSLDVPVPGRRAHRGRPRPADRGA